MSEQINSELKKLMAIAHDLELSVDLRSKAIEQIGKIGTHDALLALLEIAANEHATIDERDMALKYARVIIKSNR